MNQSLERKTAAKTHLHQQKVEVKGEQQNSTNRQPFSFNISDKKLDMILVLARHIKI